MNRLARMAMLTLALLCLFTIGAGAAIARLLPARLALFQIPAVSAKGLRAPGSGLSGAGGSPGAGQGGAGSGGAGQATAAGVQAKLSGLIGGLGPDAGALVVDLRTGKALYAVSANSGFTPASTTKIATAVAAIDVLGPQAKFTTSVVLPAAAGGGAARSIVLVGGGDPVLAAAPYPAAEYPRPATLKSLAAHTAVALRHRGASSVQLRYDGSLFSGPLVAAGWPSLGAPGNYVVTGNMTIITGLEVDQGRLTAKGTPEDFDDAGNFRPRSMDPALEAAKAFAGFLHRDGIAVHLGPATSAGRGKVLAAVHSPPLSQIVQQMLTESNNVIAETLARHVAIATGRPATFAGAAAAVMAVDRRLGVSGIHLHDGSGLSPLNTITPRALVALVRLAAGAGPAGLRAVISGMPVAGFSGTLAPGSLFGPFGHPALGTVRAKTGNLNGVATMAGIAYTQSGQLLAFAFMANKIPARLGAGPMSALASLATAVASCGCG